MARKRKEAPTEREQQQAAEAAHAAELAASPVDQPLPTDSDAVPLHPTAPPELVDDQGVVPAEGAAEIQGTVLSGEPTPDSPAAHPATARGHQEQHGGRRGVDKRVLNGVHLNLIDDGNYGGMGIQIDVENPGDKPTPDETAVLKEGGLRYRAGEWRGGIDRRDPAGSRNGHHRTFDRLAEKYGEREGGGHAR